MQIRSPVYFHSSLFFSALRWTGVCFPDVLIVIGFDWCQIEGSIFPHYLFIYLQGTKAIPGWISVGVFTVWFSSFLTRVFLSHLFHYEGLLQHFLFMLCLWWHTVTFMGFTKQDWEVVWAKLRAKLLPWFEVTGETTKEKILHCRLRGWKKENSTSSFSCKHASSSSVLPVWALFFVQWLIFQGQQCYSAQCISLISI